ncbi:MAG: hypothetical protein WHV44_16260 [Anaerolineales bacterium]
MKMADEASVAQVRSLAERVEEAFTEAQSIYKTALWGLAVGFFVSGLLALWPGVGVSQRAIGVTGLPVTLVIFLLLIYRNPLQNARKAMADVIKMQAIYLTYLRRLNQLDLGFKRAYLSNEKFSPALFEKTSEKMQEVIDKTLDDINLLMEELN